HLVEAHQPSLRLRHDLLADDQDVALDDRGVLSLCRFDDEARDVVARADFGDALDRDDLVPPRHYRGLPPVTQAATRAPMAHVPTSLWLSLAAGSTSSASRSGAASTSSPRPGNGSTCGTSPARRAVARCAWNDGSPKVSAIASGGVSATPLVPRP